MTFLLPIRISSSKLQLVLLIRLSHLIANRVQPKEVKGGDSDPDDLFEIASWLNEEGKKK